MIRNITVLIFFLLSSVIGHGQFGIGATVTNDLYQRLSNPDDDIAYGGNGSFLLNVGLGPKIWIGGENVSLSIESQAVIAPLGIALKDFKGVGAVSFPIMAKMNFAGLSGLNREGRFGLSIGGGVQYNRTELFGLKNSYEDQGVVREYFKTYVIQAGYGFGLSGFTVHGFVRYGFNPDLEANNFHIGLQYDFNAPMLKRISDPASEL